MLAQNFIFGITQQAFPATIPAGDMALRIDGEEGVVSYPFHQHLKTSGSFHEPALGLRADGLGLGLRCRESKQSEILFLTGGSRSIDKVSNTPDHGACGESEADRSDGGDDGDDDSRGKPERIVGIKINPDFEKALHASANDKRSETIENPAMRAYFRNPAQLYQHPQDATEDHHVGGGNKNIHGHIHPRSQ